jgi:hypothetical protein
MRIIVGRFIAAVISLILASTFIPSASGDSQVSRTVIDQADSLNGFSLKFVYVVPSDGVDQNSDTNGTISSAILNGEYYLSQQIGGTLGIDKFQGNYDIQYFKSAQSSAALDDAKFAVSDLPMEMGLKLDPSRLMINQKHYVFMVELPAFENRSVCGRGQMPGLFSVVAIGKGICNPRLPYPPNLQGTVNWIHETFHMLGVQHTMDNICDIMSTVDLAKRDKYCFPFLTMDSAHSRYFGSSNQGVDIHNLPVWLPVVQELPRPTLEAFKVTKAKNTPTGKINITFSGSCTSGGKSVKLAWKSQAPSAIYWQPDRFVRSCVKGRFSYSIQSQKNLDFMVLELPTWAPSLDLKGP